MLTATYSPEDDKLRLYSSTRLDSETYERVKAHGFRWAPAQELFFAVWSPERADLLESLAGDIEDEDKSLAERAEERAERFEDYSENRRADSERAHAAVSAIADGIPLGQPILVGHHSERRARKDAERIENGMRRAVKMWETSQYWKDRAAGALAHAKYKELPGVRARRIKTIEAEKRKLQRSQEEAARWLRMWTACANVPDEVNRLQCARKLAGCSWLTLPRKEGDREGITPSADAVLKEDPSPIYARRTLAEVIEYAIRVHQPSARLARWVEHLDNRLAYERAMLGESGAGKASQFDIQPGGRVLVGGRWLLVISCTRKAGQLVSMRTSQERHCGRVLAEQVEDYRPPTDEEADTVKKATAKPPLCNYPGPGIVEVTWAEWDAVNSDYKSTTRCAGRGSKKGFYGDTDHESPHALHRVRCAMAGPLKKRTGRAIGTEGATGSYHGLVQVFITDKPRRDPPKFEEVAPRPSLRALTADQDIADAKRRLERIEASKRAQETDRAPEWVDSAKDVAKNGVQVVTAPDLFPTPPEVASMICDAAEDGFRLLAGARILEPSAGTGNIIRAVHARTTGPDCCRVDCVDVSPACCGALKARREKTVYANESNWGIELADFLEVDPRPIYDFVLMNPPFSGGADMRHVGHALKFLKPGASRLVAIMAGGPRQRAWLESLGRPYSLVDLPDGSFASSGTDVRTVLVTVDG